MNPMLTLSASELARRIRSRRLTSQEAVEVHLAHLQRVNPALNALVADRFAAARQEARAADERVASEDPAHLPPFLGVPCTVKEAFLLTGMPNSSGMRARAARIAQEDAPAVARLRAAGAIPLGVTNVSELCMWMETHNTVYGRTGNAYDSARTPGGSSGGEGALVGSGAVPFGLGSDVGGSIRMPAFFNGVFGHKPTGGLIPNTGQYPYAENDARRYLTTGPLCRRAEDLAPLVRLLAGPDGQDGGCLPWPLGDPATVDLAGLRVLDVPDNGQFSVRPELRRAQTRAADHLAACGARVEQRRFAGLKQSTEIWSTMLTEANGRSYAQLLGQGQPFRHGRETLRFLTGRSDLTFPSLGLALIELVPMLFPKASQRYIQAGEALKEELHEVLGDDGVMLFPAYPEPAPRHRQPLLLPFKWCYTAIFNVMENPATAVPLGLGRRGLPLGIQVVARRGNDHLCLAVAQELERAFGGWVPPARWR